MSAAAKLTLMAGYRAEPLQHVACTSCTLQSCAIEVTFTRHLLSLQTHVFMLNQGGKGEHSSHIILLQSIPGVLQVAQVVRVVYRMHCNIAC